MEQILVTNTNLYELLIEKETKVETDGQSLYIEIDDDIYGIRTESARFSDYYTYKMITINPHELMQLVRKGFVVLDKYIESENGLLKLEVVD